MGDQCVDQSAVRIARCGMHHQPGGLVDDDEVVVLIDHVQRDILALRLGGYGRRDRDGEFLAGFDPQIRVFYGRARSRNRAFRQKRLQAGARKIGQMRCQKTVEPLAFIRVARARCLYGGFRVRDFHAAHT